MGSEQDEKTVKQPPSQIPELDPPDHTPPALHAGRGLETDALAELVWKHFREEITEVLKEVQERLASEQEDSIQNVNHRN